MLGQVPMPSARDTEAAEKAEAAEKLQAAAKAEAMEKWIDELKLQARLCRVSPLAFSVTIPEQRHFDGRAFPLTLVPAAAAHAPAMLKARWGLYTSRG